MLSWASMATRWSSLMRGTFETPESITEAATFDSPGSG